MRVTFMKLGKPKQFNFKSRFYDPEKEERDNRKRLYDRKSEDYEYSTDDMRNEMEYRWNLNRVSKNTFNKRYTSLNRILMTALILAVIVAILVYVKVS